MSEIPEETTALIIRFSALGDVAMTVPPVIDAALASPSSYFFVLTRMLPTGAYGPLGALPPNLHVMPVELKEYKGLLGLWRLADELYEELGPDFVIDLHDVLRSRILTFFLRLRQKSKIVRIDKGRAAKRALTRRRNKEKVQLATGDARYRDVFKRAGFPTPEAFQGFFTEARTRRLADAGRTPRIAIAPFAAHPGKEWPLHYIEEVINHFSTRPGMEILLFGAGAREKDIIARWTAKWPGIVTDMPAKGLRLAEEMREMADCDVMLSMDSANMHLASLAGIPVVSVWGATDPLAGFLGWRQNEADAIRLDMECRPCSVFGNKPCRIASGGSRPCLDHLRAQPVIEAIERHLPH